MCEELQELYDEGVKEGEMLGEMKKAKRSALLLSKKGTGSFRYCGSIGSRHRYSTRVVV